MQPATILNKAIGFLENGKDFTIRAVNLSSKNKYIKAATLNGKPLDNAFFDHTEIVAGGELVLTMDAISSPWGTNTVPPSKSNQ